MHTDEAGTISRQSLEDQATNLIRRRIVDGEFAPGERLVEAALAHSYGLSRGTIRAALRRLISEGLVYQIPYSGYRVVEFSEHDLWEIYTLRAALEKLGARLAAERISKEGARELRAAYGALLQTGQQDDCRQASRRDHELHRLIIRLSGHQRLAQHYERVAKQFRTYIVLSNRNVNLREIGESHRELVESICAHDPDRAERLADANIPSPAAIGALQGLV